MVSGNNQYKSGNQYSSDSGSGLKLVYVIGTYPILTTTFIDREIRGLRKNGVQVQVLSIRKPRPPLSPDQVTMAYGVIYLIPVSYLAFILAHLQYAIRSPIAYFGTLFYLLSRPNQSINERLKTGAHFAEGVYAAYKLRNLGFDQLHAHFLDRATTVAMVVGRLLKVPYTLTAHANDIYVRPQLIVEKMEQAQRVITCTEYNRSHLMSIQDGSFDSKIRCIYHGLETDSYREAVRSNDDPTLVLCVAQLKEKKGLSYLIRACRILKDRGYTLTCHIVGEGPLRQSLVNEILKLGLENTVFLRGALVHEEVIALYYRSTMFALSPVVSADGDRDGIPNVILEAMAAGLPVVSTNHSGIPEVIQNGINGLLVSTADENSLAEAMAWIIDHPQARQELGQAGKRTILEKFDADKNTARLLKEFISVHQSMQ